MSARVDTRRKYCKYRERREVRCNATANGDGNDEGQKEGSDELNGGILHGGQDSGTLRSCP
jgi:hypothetical protein